MCIRDRFNDSLCRLVHACEKIEYCCLTGTVRSDPVSYTHLDVYKRQVYIHPDHAFYSDGIFHAGLLEIKDLCKDLR